MKMESANIPEMLVPAKLLSSIEEKPRLVVDRSDLPWPLTRCLGSIGLINVLI
jgi:hypothetical protein